MKAAMGRGSREASRKSVTMAELKNKISIFRDLLDLPPSVGSVSVNEWLIVTLEDIRRMYPNLKLGTPMLEGKEVSMHKSLKLFCDTLKSVGDLWMSEKGMSNCKYNPSKKLGHRELERIALKLLDEMIKLARERSFEERKMSEEMRHSNHPASSFKKDESGSYSDGAKSPNPGSPVTPTSVLHGPRKSRGKFHSPRLPKSKSVQSIRKLSSMDLKRISFYMLPDAISVAQLNKHSAKWNQIDTELERKKADFVNKVSEDDIVDNMEISNEVNKEAEVKSDAFKIGRSDLVEEVSEDDADEVINEDVIVDYVEMSIDINAEPEVISDAFKFGRSDLVGKVSHDSVMLDYMEMSNEITGENEMNSDESNIHSSDLAGKVDDEGRNWIISTYEKPVTAPMASLRQEDPAPVSPPSLPPNVTEPTASEPACAVSVPLLITPQPPASVPMPNSTEQDQPTQLPLCTSPPPDVAPVNMAGPPPLPLETYDNAVCAPPGPPSSPPMPEKPSAKLPGISSDAVCAPPSPPPQTVGGHASPPPPPMSPINGSVPPPRPMGGSKWPTPPPPMPNGGHAPPPPPGGGGASLRLKKAATKLKRSSQMGNLYRRLKGKVEGIGSEGKTSGGKKCKPGAPAGGKQGMADALAEMTKKSAYFLQIEEDVKNYSGVVKELKTAINAFQTSDMTELVKFHRYVESHLEKLTDESQVLARCEDFPCRKLEALRMSATLYTKLDTMATTLRDWSVGGLTLAQKLDKAESYFNKIKVDLDVLERTKDDELKRFQAQKINFDFSILIRIKELMVDVSSNCMESALKEKEEAKSKENGQPNEGLRKLMWRTFQFAYRVYTFAGGQDERADQLTKELAEAIETGF